MKRSEEAACVHKLHDLWNSGDLDRIPQVYAADFVAHMPKGWERSEFAVCGMHLAIGTKQFRKW